VERHSPISSGSLCALAHAIIDPSPGMNMPRSGKDLACFDNRLIEYNKDIRKIEITAIRTKITTPLALIYAVFELFLYISNF